MDHELKMVEEELDFEEDNNEDEENKIDDI